MKKPWIGNILALGLLTGTLGCAYTLSDLDERYVAVSFVKERWLNYIQDGNITKKEVVTLLGPSTEIFEQGQILVFRLILGERNIDTRKPPYNFLRVPSAVEAYNSQISAYNKMRKELASQEALLVVGREYGEKEYSEILGRQAEYSLVMVFDESGTLRRHRLLRVRP
jgi:hypothetical protein